MDPRAGRLALGKVDGFAQSRGDLVEGFGHACLILPGRLVGGRRNPSQVEPVAALGNFERLARRDAPGFGQAHRDAITGLECFPADGLLHRREYPASEEGPQAQLSPNCCASPKLGMGGASGGRR